MNPETISFLSAQRTSAENPLGSHQARSRDIAIRLAKKNPYSARCIADEITANTSAASEVSGFHPDSCLRLADWLRDWRRAL